MVFVFTNARAISIMCNLGHSQLTLEYYSTAKITGLLALRTKYI